MATWGLAAAKARLSEVVELAFTHEPQKITRNGKAVAIVVSIEDWTRHVGSKPEGTFLDFFQRSPLSQSRIDLSRPRMSTRRVKF